MYDTSAYVIRTHVYLANERITTAFVLAHVPYVWFSCPKPSVTNHGAYTDVIAVVYGLVSVIVYNTPFSH